MAYYWITLLFFLFCSAQDLKRKKVNWLISALVTVVMISSHIVLGDMDWLNLAAGVGLGFILLIIAWVTGEAIGYGDGMVMTACGAALGLSASAQVLIIGLFLAALWSGFLLFLKRANRKSSFPFVPFLAAAQFCTIISTFFTSGMFAK